MDHLNAWLPFLVKGLEFAFSLLIWPLVSVIFIVAFAVIFTATHNAFLPKAKPWDLRYTIEDLAGKKQTIIVIVLVIVTVFPLASLAGMMSQVTSILITEQTQQAITFSSIDEPIAMETSSPTEELPWITQSFGTNQLDADFWDRRFCASGITAAVVSTGRYRFLAEQIPQSEQTPTSAFNDLNRSCFLDFKGNDSLIEKVKLNVSYSQGIGYASNIGIFTRCGGILVRLLLHAYGVRGQNGDTYSEYIRDYGTSGKQNSNETLVMDWDGENVTLSIEGGQLPSVVYPCDGYPSSLQFGIILQQGFGIDASMHKIEIWKH